MKHAAIPAGPALLIALIAIFLFWSPEQQGGAPARERIAAAVRVFYAPRDDLSQVDRDLVAQARDQIDVAAYVLTDASIIEALMEAARRGAHVRVLLDPDQPAARNGDRAGPFWRLLAAPNVAVRVKINGRDMMHLKSYQIDGRILRTGSANFSVSGARHQDNDLVVLESRQAAGDFRARFEEMWSRGGPPPFATQALAR